MLYKILTAISALLFIYLFNLLFFSSSTFLSDVGLPGNADALFMGKRAAMLMLGMAFFNILGFQIVKPHLRVQFCLMITTVLVALGFLGLHELDRGVVNEGIMTAVYVEFTLAGLFVIAAASSLKGYLASQIGPAD
ncbi:hypothetical protein VIBNISFn27_730004 [Vibrio nigripulchritudo SFn27]|uniref:Uncharacterized protein n=1 Tax=Vibrio nigripulchritudo TaxID=28173 RepID=U4K4B8_9VIBR|nr:hypothetical protein [Vibrio nigripulchritudo]CCN85867.1 hypothetical protein VIBNIBLFn1_990053 [Vibrio nigripulchritudo BLFn1]CCN90481.1 hypothetical protein VIBNISFn27_730004 [Vibrio nigripulchritudo SFn27]CCN93600.1 hypothetical protein VIBNIENn2_260004 [Vibrio nigripulchritudo ENn2]CCO42923.1 hypothetical protein VIBNISFn135_90004 [Vibrio nigripulchritudo SFn135]CCO50716.1 hypothetical protein VIBNIWn13_1030004 [Vibrio nigripulchritudo Wn13]